MVHEAFRVVRRDRVGADNRATRLQPADYIGVDCAVPGIPVIFSKLATALVAFFP